MKWSTLLFALLSFHSLAEVDPSHVESMLDQMVQQNVVSKEEAQKAKIRLRSMNKDQWTEINRQAQSHAARMPASASENKIQEVNRIDLDGDQFKQIQNDLKKIVPEYKD